MSDQRIAFGDSITVGVGASTPENAYINLIAASKGWTIINNGINGKQLADLIDGIYGTAITYSAISLALLGFNDMRYHGTNSAGQLSFQRELYSALAWLAIPATLRLNAQNALIAYAGSWSNLTIWGGALGKFSATNGSTATFTLSGSVLYIDLIQFQNYTRGINITVDGVDKGTYEGSAFTPTAAARAYAPYLIRIAGLTSGPHTVVLTVTNGTGNAFFNWAFGVANPQAAKIAVGNCLKMTATGYTLGSPFWNGSDLAVSQFNAIIAACVANLASDGLSVVLADASSQYDPYTQVSADNIHPNDSGHSTIAGVFLEQLPEVTGIAGKSAVTAAVTGMSQATAAVTGQSLVDQE